MKEILEIIKYKLVWLNITLVLIFGAGIYLSEYFAIPFFILTINLFDILGYHFTLIRRTTVMPEKIIIKAYRLNQFMFEDLLLILLFFLFEWKIAVASAIIKLTGMQDVLYYLFLKKDFPSNWHWMKWTPLGFIKSNLTTPQVILQTIFGILLSILILIHQHVQF